MQNKFLQTSAFALGISCFFAADALCWPEKLTFYNDEMEANVSLVKKNSVVKESEILITANTNRGSGASVGESLEFSDKILKLLVQKNAKLVAIFNYTHDGDIQTVECTVPLKDVETRLEKKYGKEVFQTSKHMTINVKSYSKILVSNNSVSSCEFKFD